MAGLPPASPCCEATDIRAKLFLEPAIASQILVHEVVHHLQQMANLTYECPAAREELAFAARTSGSACLDAAYRKSSISTHQGEHHLGLAVHIALAGGPKLGFA